MSTEKLNDKTNDVGNELYSFIKELFDSKLPPTPLKNLNSLCQLVWT